MDVVVVASWGRGLPPQGEAAAAVQRYLSHPTLKGHYHHHREEQQGAGRRRRRCTTRSIFRRPGSVDDDWKPRGGKDDDLGA